MAESRPDAGLRAAVANAAARCCEYCRCQEDFSPDTFSIEHVVPRARGGTNEPSNLAYACLGCNNRKHTATAAIDPASGERVRLFHPRRDRWQDHFLWSLDFTRIIGMTPIGRATVERLALNRHGIVNLRRVLRTCGEHPPALDA